MNYTGGTDNTVTYASGGGGATLAVDGGSTVNYANGTGGTVVGDGNQVDVLGTGSDIDASNETFDISGDDASTTINGNGNLVDAGAGTQTDANGTGNTLNLVDNSDSSVSVGGYGSATVNGAGATVDLGYNASLTLGDGDTGVIVDGSDSSVTASDGASFTLDGSGNVVTASNVTVYASDNEQLTIDGNNDVVVGGTNDSFTVDGTDDGLSATDSEVTFDGTNAGDGLSGDGDSWTDPDLGTGGDGDLDPGGDGGDGYSYGYGLTKYKGKSPSAEQVAATEHSDNMYEGAAWADKTITWSFAEATGSFSDAITSKSEQIAIEQAFKSWAKASGLKFEEVAAGTSADIDVGFSDLTTASTNTIGLTKYTSQGGSLNRGVQIELEDPDQVPLTTNANGNLAYASTDTTFEQVALHEIGHALGLADNDVAGSIMNAVLGSNNQMLDAADIENVQRLYGNTLLSDHSSPASYAQSVAQLHQLVQAMSTFDVSEVAFDSGNGSSMSDATLYRDHLLTSTQTSAHMERMS